MSRTALYTCLFFPLLLAAEAQGTQNEQFFRELNLLAGYSRNEKWIGSFDELKNSVGFEYYRRFSNEQGDYLTVDLQVRSAYDSRLGSDNAFGIEIHNAWLEYKLDIGRYLKIGHFDPAFGLEPLLDTHGTLLQTLAMRNIGFKKDWGIGYRSLLGDYDLELAAQLGSGMPIRRTDDSFLLTARIGSSKNEDFKYGFSALYGRVLSAENDWTIPVKKTLEDGILKKRLGFDMQFPVGLFSFKTEFAAGTDEDRTVAGAMSQIEYVPPENQRLSLKLQGQYWTDKWETKGSRNLTIAPVAEYKMNPATTFRIGYFNDLYAGSGNKDRIVVVQLYYYGK
jgi:hypothetical protein